ncbi:uncharacterized protein LAESUDRAFT_725001 [Laetiporus sulphureus 93-53]|uniref:Uncharacterized protein n=1 Tax=Laetiporus sulphureus 93-53 TaxID=1314785 RepID=A0A165EQA5_9APHY|nr:uncharacterized protein LAESUDRAFT_725001 [Laetiporus sulphureus 93-53]KZT07541.1 hypothetical protein LAESUDRAFT_725001 [Laetiporus sulphureus 93-53]
MSESSQRYAKAQYRGTNGFQDPARRRVQGQVQVPELHKKPQDEDEAAVYTYERELYDAVERRRLAEAVLEIKGSYFPDLEVLEEMNERPETAAGVTERIEELQKRHEEDMQTLLERQADDYLMDAEDRYHSSDDTMHDSNIDSFYRTARGQNTPMFNAFDDAASSFEYAHLRTLGALCRERDALAAKEDDARRQRDSKFPANIMEYRSITNKSIQLRIARFLMADSARKERMQTDFNWVWRQVMNLVGEYEKNKDFQAEIQELARDAEARDPRRKPSNVGVSF